MSIDLIKFFIISIAGTLGHFLYEWTGENRLIGWFFPTNESTFEHLKLLFFPAVIYSVIECCIKKKPCHACLPSVLSSVLWGLITIVACFYTYTGVLGFNVDFLNILIYLVSVAVFTIKSDKQSPPAFLNNNNACLLSALVLIAIAFLFLYFTENPPPIAIFESPV